MLNDKQHNPPINISLPIKYSTGRKSIECFALAKESLLVTSTINITREIKTTSFESSPKQTIYHINYLLYNSKD